MKFICVFCGSSIGKSEVYKQEAHKFGETLADKRMGLVYGGASIGIMGAIAESVLTKSGEVVGVIPRFLDKREVGHSGLSEKIEVDSMHERKEIMYNRSDAFVIFPGGLGTLDEFFEILTWKQLELHAKPIIIYNLNGFYDPLVAQVESFNREGFITPSHLELFQVVSSQEDLFKHL